MVLDLFKQVIPWAIVIAIVFFLWLIGINRNRLYKIRYSGRVSEIIDRRRNIIFFAIVITLLVLGLLIDLYA